jgi:hypothetical protein
MLPTPLAIAEVIEQGWALPVLMWWTAPAPGIEVP